MIKPILYIDIECYPNYFLVMLMNETGNVVSFEQFDGQALDTHKLATVVCSDKYEFTSFNGINYDKPMLSLALTGATCEQLKQASDEIIVREMPPWEFARAYDQYGVEVLPDHVDLFNLAPGKLSLKLYGGRLHSPKLQELPISPDRLIEPEERPVLRRYCRNDLIVTQTVRRALDKPIELRRVMNAEMAATHNDPAGVMPLPDLRSKSDAQIAEAVLKSRVFNATGAVPRKWPISYKQFTYEPPSYIKFSTGDLQQALETIRSATFVIKDTGHVKMPGEISRLKIQIGGSTYKLGLGGLHSQEKEVTHYADETTLLRDIDVESYYPSMILNMGMYPDSMGPHFITAYGNIKTERLEAKHSGQKVKSDALKLTINSTFGKTSNRYSILYNPRMMIATTITGQLSLLMLIEALEKRGIAVVSANTDGIVVKCGVEREPMLKRIVQAWEQVTSLKTEETNYTAIHSRDVNNYLAFKPDGEIKTKGFFALPSDPRSRLAKSPQNEICVEAVIAYLKNGTPMEDTIRACEDITKFITLRTVNGGATMNGAPVGKVVRWYYSTVIKGHLEYKTNGNMVPRTTGARPIMDLPDGLPDDLDYDWYIKECRELLMDLGVVKRPPKPKLPRRNSKEWKRMVEQGLIDPITNTPLHIDGTTYTSSEDRYAEAGEPTDG